MIDVMMIENKDELNPVDAYDSKVSSIPESVDGIFDSTKALGWYF